MGRYLAYSLVFDSDVDLPEFPLCTGDYPVDVTLRLGMVPESIPDPVGRGVLYEASAAEFLLTIPDVARFHVVAGNSITVEPTPGVPLGEVRVFLLGSAVGALLHQRGLLVLHAAAIKTEFGAVCFAGASGAGKSTLLGEMLRRGCAMVVDDVCALDAHDGVVRVLPGYPRTRLWADSAGRLDVDTTELTRTRSTIEKFERQVPEQFHAEATPLRALYILGSDNHDTVRIEHVPPIQAFSAMLFQTYRRRFVEQLGVIRTHFELVTKAARQCSVAEVQRPAGRFALDELADAVEADLVDRFDSPSPTA